MKTRRPQTPPTRSSEKCAANFRKTSGLKQLLASVNTRREEVPPLASFASLHSPASLFLPFPASPPLTINKLPLTPPSPSPLRQLWPEFPDASAQEIPATSPKALISNSCPFPASPPSSGASGVFICLHPGLDSGRGSTVPKATRSFNTATLPRFSSNTWASTLSSRSAISLAISPVRSVPPSTPTSTESRSCG